MEKTREKNVFFLFDILKCKQIIHIYEYKNDIVSKIRDNWNLDIRAQTVILSVSAKKRLVFPDFRNKYG